jgi:hypothetical protein
MCSEPPLEDFERDPRSFIELPSFEVAIAMKPTEAVEDRSTETAMRQVRFDCDGSRAKGVPAPNDGPQGTER